MPDTPTALTAQTHPEIPASQESPSPEQPPATESKPSHTLLILALLAGFILILILGGILLFVNKSQDPAKISTAMQKETPQTEIKTITPGTLTIGTDATFAPMEYVDQTTGELIGYDIDLGHRLAEKLGLQAEFQNIPWDELFMELDKNNIDVVMAAVTITEERQQSYNFSNSYLNAGQVLITRRENTDISDIKHLAEKRIAVQQGTTNAEEAYKHVISPENVLEFVDFQDSVNALLNEEADALISDFTGAKGLITEYPNLKIASEPFTQEPYGIMIQQQNTQLVEHINQALDSLRQEGVLVLLKQKWLE